MEIFSNPVLSYHKIHLRPERTSNRISSISKWLFKNLPQIMEQLSYTEHNILRMCCIVEGMLYNLFHGQTGSLHWNSNHMKSWLSRHLILPSSCNTQCWRSQIHYKSRQGHSIPLGLLGLLLKYNLLWRNGEAVFSRYHGSSDLKTICCETVSNCNCTDSMQSLIPEIWQNSCC